MEAVVGGGLLGPAAPFAKGVHQRLARAGDHEVDDAGGAAGQTRCRAGKEIIDGRGAHEGQLHVRVRINAAGHDVLPVRINDRGAGWGVDLRRHLQDGAAALGAGAEHVGTPGAVCIDDRAATDQGRHVAVSLWVVWVRSWMTLRHSPRWRSGCRAASSTRCRPAPPARGQRTTRTCRAC